MLTEPIVITRFPEYQKGTPGEATYKNQKICHTLELPWRCNQVAVSCIPLGKYELVRSWSESFQKYTYEVIVQGRTGIRFHAGNFLSETQGCIMPCVSFCISQEIWGIHSKEALINFEQVVAENRVSRLIVTAA